jgi:hypothetical protein
MGTVLPSFRPQDAKHDKLMASAAEGAGIPSLAAFSLLALILIGFRELVARSHHGDWVMPGCGSDLLGRLGDGGSKLLCAHAHMGFSSSLLGFASIVLEGS